MEDEGSRAEAGTILYCPLQHRTPSISKDVAHLSKTFINWKVTLDPQP